eukprot:4839743-Pleurochrysis_carterae.AAC.1
MGPRGRGAFASPRFAESGGSRGSAGRVRLLCFLLGAPRCWGSASPSGMGSFSSCAAGVCARLRRDAKAGGMARASSTWARTYAESWGPSAVMRPPSASSAPAAPGRVAPMLLPAAAASMSASAWFSGGG